MLKFLAIFILLFAFGYISVIYGQTLGGFAVVLSKTKVQQWCHISKDPNVACPFGGERVNIHVEMGSEMDVSMRYHVSGGRIIGSGKDVVWDLTNILPGHYKVTVKAKQGGKSIAAITKTIELEPCPDCDVGCTCPTLTLMPSRSTVGPGDIVVFIANVAGLKPTSYRWKVENGKIIKGSKSKELTVRASELGAGQKLTATVEIGGTDLACSCMTTDSETVEILPKR